MEGSDTSNAEFVDIKEDDKSPWYKFHHNKAAQGFNGLGLAHGPLVMSNIFLSTAIIFLASKQADCLDEDGETVIDNCPNRVYGMKPASVISNIAVVAGVLSALCMPVVGAIIDYTPHRKNVGMITAAVIVVVQAAQAFTNSNNWFIMAILQALVGCVYQSQVLTKYAYLPDIARIAGQDKMTTYTATFTMNQFAAQSLYLILIIALTMIFSLDDVQAARISQAINAVLILIVMTIAWKIIPFAPTNHKLQPGRSIWAEGFRQIGRTITKIRKNYRKGLLWYFFALAFAEAAVNSFTVVSVVYLDDHKGMSGTEIGIFFLTALVFSLPGSVMGSKITARLNPKTSYILSMVVFFFVTNIGAIAVDVVDSSVVAYTWSAVVGICIGWFYPTENLYFSVILPKGQEAELSGFYVYCSQILAWAPPLIFTGLVELDISQTYGVMSVSVFFLVAIILILQSGTWEEMLHESSAVYDPNNIMLKPSEMEAQVAEPL